MSLQLFFVSQPGRLQNPLYIPDTISGSVIPLQLQQGSVSFFPGTVTQTMGANGPILGPTIMLNRFQQVTMQVSNTLPDSTTVHWHGMHVAPQNDGGPHTPIVAGGNWSPSFVVLDKAATLWYHPHLHFKTYDQVQLGIAGFIYVRDSAEALLSLPRTYGVDDIPLAIQTKGMDSNYQIRTDHTALDTLLLVNGTYRPYVSLPAQWVRLRLLNGSPERVYNFGFSDNRSFSMIASDNGLLAAPVSLTRILLAPGERAEILVDLSSDLGQSLFLRNYGSSIPSGRYGALQPGMGANQTIPDYTNNPLNGSDFNVLEINVVSQTLNPVLQISSTLIPQQPWLSTQANTTRTLTFTMMGGMGGGGGANLTGPFVINGAHFDMSVINFRVPFENIEIWELRNQTPIAHPFHIHNVPFYILDINGVAPPAQLRGKKDVVLVPPGNGVVRFITKFEDFYNDTLPYMYHCHMLTHEDDGMMGQFVVESPCEIIDQQPQSVSVLEGTVVQFSVGVGAVAGATYRWQVNMGLGFQDLQDAGQYSGTQTSTLTISNVALSNDNQFYRCIVGSDACTVTSESAQLKVEVLGMEEWEGGELLLYPNPSNMDVTLEIKMDWVGSNWDVFDLQGRRVGGGVLGSKKERISIDGLPFGTYIIRVMGEKGVGYVRWIRM